MEMGSGSGMSGNAHMLESFRKLKHLFRAKVTIIPIGDKRFVEDDECGGSPAVDGLPEEQEASLTERNSDGREGVEPSDCASAGCNNGN